MLLCSVIAPCQAELGAHVGQAAHQEAIDAMREALAAFREAQEVVIDQRVTARLERIKGAITQWRAGEELAADIFFWLVKERAAFRGETEWPKPQSASEASLQKTIEHYRSQRSDYKWPKLKEAALDSDGGLQSLARIIASQVIAARPLVAATWA
jgi:hypothetical protein